jgi:cobalt-zinc-cadmium efflux system protein
MDHSHQDHHHRHEEHATSHNHRHKAGPRRSLLGSFALTVSFLAAEAIGGWLTNSLALLSDAGHMLTDAGALGLSLLALRIGEMPPSTTKTFGYRRFEILAALLNGLALWGIVGVILREAYERLLSPPQIEASGMIAIAGLGLCANLISIRLLHSHREDNINLRGAFLHVVADSLGSAGALGAGVIVWATGWNLADPLVSVGICGLVLWSSWGLVKDSVHILLLGVPPHIDYRSVEDTILQSEGVCCVYDLHVWSIASGQEALSAHVVVPDGYPKQRELLHGLADRLRDRFGIDHATLQIEETHEMKEELAGAVCRVDGASAACAMPNSVEQQTYGQAR